jgi:HPt (histidine-containing phosphotransfer) domain-containing protein
MAHLNINARSKFCAPQQTNNNFKAFAITIPAWRTVTDYTAFDLFNFVKVTTFSRAAQRSNDITIASNSVATSLRFGSTLAFQLLTQLVEKTSDSVQRTELHLSVDRLPNLDARIRIDLVPIDTTIGEKKGYLRSSSGGHAINFSTRKISDKSVKDADDWTTNTEVALSDSWRRGRSPDFRYSARASEYLATEAIELIQILVQNKWRLLFISDELNTWLSLARSLIPDEDKFTVASNLSRLNGRDFDAVFIDERLVASDEWAQFTRSALWSNKSVYSCKASCSLQKFEFVRLWTLRNELTLSTDSSSDPNNIVCYNDYDAQTPVTASAVDAVSSFDFCHERLGELLDVLGKLKFQQASENYCREIQDTLSLLISQICAPETKSARKQMHKLLGASALYGANSIGLICQKMDSFLEKNPDSALPLELLQDFATRALRVQCHLHVLAQLIKTTAPEVSDSSTS